MDARTRETILRASDAADASTTESIVEKTMMQNSVMVFRGVERWDHKNGKWIEVSINQNLKK